MTIEDEDDACVLERSLRDPEEFAVIFDRHFVTIHRYLARRAGSDAADDLASEVFTVAFSRRGSYDTSRRLALPWLYGIASNVLRADARRRRKHDHAALDVDAVRAGDHFEERVVASLDAHRQVRDLGQQLSRLSEDDRTTLLLYAWEDLSYEDIAVALEIPVGTVRSRLNRVRRNLREPIASQVTSTEHDNDHDPTGGDR